jgi:monothiol glutaredoxin
VQILQLQGVPAIKGINVLEDEDLRSGIKEYSHVPTDMSELRRSWPTIPQVYVKGEFVGGCDILLNMHRSGELEDLLVEKGVVQANVE